MVRDFKAGAEAPEAVLHLVELLRAFEAATLITRSRGGGLQGRPTSIAQVEDNATVWLVTSAASIRAEEIAEDARAMLTLQASLRFVSVNGRAELVSGAAELAARWKESYRVWHDGQSEREIALVRFTAFDAEYWDDSSARGLRYVFRASKSREADEDARAKEPEAHAKLRLWAPESGGTS
jgi:general stress protein 26